MLDRDQTAHSQNESGESSMQDVRPTLVIVDPRAGGADAIVAALESEGAAAIEVIRLDADRSGIGQVSDRLAEHGEAAGLHLVPDRVEGGARLGTDWLTRETVVESVAEISAWKSALTGKTGVVLHGCDLESTVEGRGLRKALAAVMNVEISGATADDVEAIVATATVDEAHALAEPEPAASAIPGSVEPEPNDGCGPSVITDEAGEVLIAGSFEHTPNAALRVEFRVDQSAGGTGEGAAGDPGEPPVARPIGFAFATTDERGIASFRVTLAATVEDGTVITALATNPRGKVTPLDLELVARRGEIPVVDEVEPEDEEAVEAGDADAPEEGAPACVVETHGEERAPAPVIETLGEGGSTGVSSVADAEAIDLLADALDRDPDAPSAVAAEAVFAAEVDDDEAVRSGALDGVCEDEPVRDASGADDSDDDVKRDGVEPARVASNGVEPDAAGVEIDEELLDAAREDEPVGTAPGPGAEVMDATTVEEHVEAHVVVEASGDAHAGDHSVDAPAADIDGSEPAVAAMSAPDRETVQVDVGRADEDAADDVQSNGPESSEDDQRPAEWAPSPVDPTPAASIPMTPAPLPEPFELAGVTFDEGTSMLRIDIEPGTDAAAPARVPGRLNLDLVNEAYGTATASVRTEAGDGRALIGAFTVLARPVHEAPALPDRDARPNEPVLTVGAIPAGATLTLDGRVLSAGDTFTAPEAIDGRLAYVCGATSGRTASFRFTATDTDGRTLRIIVAAVVQVSPALADGGDAAEPGPDGPSVRFVTPRSATLAESVRTALVSGLEAGPRRVEIRFRTPGDVAGAVAIAGALWRIRGSDLMACTLALLPGKRAAETAAEWRQAG